MPKLKTHSGTKDRIKITKTGKVLRGRAFGSHNLSKKSMARKRRINSTAVIESPAIAKQIKRKLGV